MKIDFFSNWHTGQGTLYLTPSLALQLTDSWKAIEISWLKWTIEIIIYAKYGKEEAVVCPMCRKYYFRVEIPKDVWNNLDDEWCPKCISDQYESDEARHRADEIKGILTRCKEIEKELPNSKNPAKLRLERSELDGQLEELEATG